VWFDRRATSPGRARGLLALRDGAREASGAQPELRFHSDSAQQALTLAQRVLSNRARLIRRRARDVAGSLTLADRQLVIDRRFLLEPVEQALRALCWSAVGLAVTLVAFRLSA